MSESGYKQQRPAKGVNQLRHIFTSCINHFKLFALVPHKQCLINTEKKKTHRFLQLIRRSLIFVIECLFVWCASAFFYRQSVTYTRSRIASKFCIYIAKRRSNSDANRLHLSTKWMDGAWAEIRFVCHESFSASALMRFFFNAKTFHLN